MNDKYIKCRVPAEWENHKATWMAWPYGDKSFSGCLPVVENIFSKMIYALSKYERVRLVVRSEQKSAVANRLRADGAEMQNIDLLETEYSDVWIRDWGPTFAHGAEPIFIKWTYNAYGAKFVDLLQDNLSLDNVDVLRKYKKVDAGIVMEGGALDFNGCGLILTTEECLLNQNRNPGLSKDKIESCVLGLLGAEQIVWLKRGLKNDHTDGHIDEIARFVAPDTVVYAWDDDGENHEIMKENLQILQGARHAGLPLKLIPLYLPKMSYANGELAPVSYCNFYIANSIVLVPQFGQPEDEMAINTLRGLFPDRQIIGINAEALVFGGDKESPTDQGGGGIHCVTQQEPNYE